MKVVELMKLVWRSGLSIEEHIWRVGFRYLLQKMCCLFIEYQQALTSADVPIADMKIGPRQGDQFTLPQAA